MRKCLAWVILLSLFVLGSCDSPQTHSVVPAPTAAEYLPGGRATVAIEPFASFLLPASNMPQALKADFYAGKALAHQPWIKAPTVTFARDGLGPIYNARTCLACHKNGGRGSVPHDASEAINNSIVRISLPGKGEHLGVLPEPIYGTQLQTQSTSLAHQLRHVLANQTGNKHSDQAMPPPIEAYIHLDWQTKTVTYPDAKQIELRYPKLKISQLGYGALHAQTLFSLRTAPGLQGLGLLELIPQSQINAWCDPDDANQDGISGRLNWVWNPETQSQVPGRFGMKANHPTSLRVFAAVAFRDDIGITNSLFPEQPCTQAQPLCLQEPDGVDANGVELPDNLLLLTTNFIRNLGVAARRPLPQQHQGRALFYQSGCQQCHRANFVTGDSVDFPHLSHQSIWPYSDFLLHDMGPALADERPDFQASGSEWRTPPLWGVGLHQQVNGNLFLLHDGRARSIEEAILWHGGEASNVRDQFVQLSAAQRQTLLEFVESL